MSIRLQLDRAPFSSTPNPVNNGDYVPVSYWQESVRVTPLPALREDTQCDVAILGGGFTGLSVACELKRLAPQLDVVLLDRAVVGHGASGRNGGFAMPLLGWDLTDAAKKFGEAGAKRAYDMMYAAVEHLRNTIRQQHINCDLEETGYLLLAPSRSRVARVKHEAELGKKLGFDMQFLDTSGVREHISSEAFLAGCYDPRPFIVNPAKLSRGLFDAARGLGVRIFEQTCVESVEDGNPIRIGTPGGTVAAPQIVLALNGYGAALGFMKHRIFPVHTYIVLTEPLSNDQLRSIGWDKRRTSLETARNLIHYFRLTVDNRILFGGEDANLYYGGRYRDHDHRLCQSLESRFREYFPGLDVRFTHRWGGVLGVTLDMIPTFGVSGAHNSIFHAAGYSGHGVALANFAGVLLAPHILTRAGIQQPVHLETPIFWNKLPTAVPPDPIRYLGLQAYRWTLKVQDALGI